jgi:hypothetical protein
MSFQTLFLALLILAPMGPVAERFAGLVPFPAEYRGKLCLLLLANLAASWLVDAFSGWLYGRSKGRKLFGRWTVS